MRPQVVAHRGASFEKPEHTLAAYLEAISEGADALECDVRLTADGHLVCVHDRDLRRTASANGLVSTMELADLDQLEFASWKNPWAVFDEPPDLAKVLTLRRLLETVAEADRRVELAIETKHPTRYGGLVERRLAELLAEFGWTGDGHPGPGDELLLRRAAADAEAGSSAAAGDADRQGPALAGAQAGGRATAGSWARASTR